MRSGRRAATITITLFLLSACGAPAAAGAAWPQNETAFGDAQRLSRSAGELMKAGKDFDAIPLAVKARDILERELPESVSFANSLTNLADLYRYTEQYEKAEPLYLRSLKVRRQMRDEVSAQYGLTMRGLGELYAATGRFEMAEETLTAAAEVIRKAQGESHPNYAHSLTALALHYTGTKDYPKAEPLLAQACGIIKGVTGEKHPEYVKCLTRQAWAYNAAQNYDGAERAYLRAAQLGKEITSEAHPYHAGLLDTAAGFYKGRGRYEEAEQLYLRASQIFAAESGERHPQNAIILAKLAQLYVSAGLYDRAETLFDRALGIQRENLGATHPRVTSLLLELSEFHALRGRYARAEEICRQVKGVLEQAGRADHLSYARTLNLLSNIYLGQGKYELAEPLLKQALEMRRKNFGENNLLYAESLDSLGEFYKLTGRYDKAAPLVARAAEVTKLKLGEQHERYALRLRSRASLSRRRGRLKEAEQLYLRGIEIVKTRRGEGASLYGEFISDLGLIYSDTGRLKEAENLYLKSVELIRQHFGEAHPNYSSALNNLAALYMKARRYNEAEPLYHRALAIMKEAGGETHPDYAIRLNNLSAIYFLTGRGGPALSSAADGMAIHQRNLTSLLGVSSERAMLAYLRKTHNYFYMLVGMAHGLKASESSAVPTALTWTLRRKGIILDTLIRARQLRQLKSGDPQAADLVLRLQAVQQQLSDTALRPAQGNRAAAADSRRKLLEEGEQLEAELARRLSALGGESPAPAPIGIEEVRHKLPPNSVLLEFVRAHTYNYAAATVEDRWGPARYYVFVLPGEAGKPPQMIDLGEAKPIDDAVRDMRRSVAQFGRSFVADTAGLIDVKAREGEYKAVAAKLYAMLFNRPDAAGSPTLRQAIGSAKSIYLSPDGSLNLVPFEALVGERRAYLAQDGLRFVYLTGGRDLLRTPTPPNRGTTVFASPNYNLPAAERVTKAAAVLARLGGGPAGGGDAQGAATPLATPYKGDRSAELTRPGDIERAQPKGGVRWDMLSDQDAKNVTLQLHGDKTYGPVRAYVGDDALEEVLKRTPPPGVLHVSTHGFFLPIRHDAPEGRPLDLGNAASAGKALLAASENPLQRSGLVLAGANMLGEGGGQRANVDDGWVTAEEIAMLNLHGTNLIVLSACETGLGDVATGEGVYGLRRAFHHAGASTIILTLFEVTDKDSARLMDGFYRRLTGGKGKADALHEARLEMAEEAAREHGAPHPFFWASFILTGDPN